MKSELPLRGLSGSICCIEDGESVSLRASGKDPGKGLYKLFLRGGEGSFLLGTMLPSEGELRLERTLKAEALRRCRCWPPECGEALLAFPFSSGEEKRGGPWEAIQNPGTLLRDKVLACSAGRCSGWLRRREENGFSLAAPYKTGMAFPLTPLFCLGRVVTLCGRPYVLYHFDENGAPQQPDKQNRQKG